MFTTYAILFGVFSVLAFYFTWRFLFYRLNYAEAIIWMISIFTTAYSAGKIWG